MPRFSIIIPCYNVQGNLPQVFAELEKLLQVFEGKAELEFVLVDDGSSDGTPGLLAEFRLRWSAHTQVLRLAGNWGSYPAILAGMAHATGQCMAVLVADLQDPPELLPQLFEFWTQGHKLAIAVRMNRESTWARKLLSALFHASIRHWALPRLPAGGFDMVLFDQQLAQEILAQNNRNVHVLNQLIALGYPFAALPYKRRRRTIGRSAWTPWKLIKLWADVQTGFGFGPVRWLFFLAALLLLAGFGCLGWAWHSGWDGPHGWLALAFSLSSLHLAGLGIVGEYAWRALQAARGMPAYVVDKHWPNTERSV